MIYFADYTPYFYAAAILLPLIGVLLLVPINAYWARRVDLTDKPGGRKHHEDNVPLVGGLSIFPVIMACLFFTEQGLDEFWALFAALSLILVVGALDDKFHINAWVKFAAQFAAALIVVLLGDARVYTVGNLFSMGEIGMGFMSIPFSVIAIVLLINAINLMDGLDGLAAGVSAVIIGWLMVACYFASNMVDFVPLSIVLAATAGFLFYNARHPFRQKASVFLGDAGSMSFGLIIGWFAIKLAQEGSQQTVEAANVAWLLALPIMDACGQFFRRVKEGRHPFDPDRGHFHHHFVDTGFSPGQSTALIMMYVCILCSIGMIGVWIGIPEGILSTFWIILLFAHMAMSYKPARFKAFLSRFTKI